jgi:uncharacterized protein involved in response to NO
MASTAEQIRTFRGPALLSYGFRPFFLFGAIWAALAVAIWLPMLTGVLTLPTAFDALQWHAHELIYGYVPAIVAGFLLTAVPNWTGRLPVTGTPLLGLFALWVAGRLAVFASASLGLLAAAAIDAAFLVVLGAVVAREIVAGRNTRNLKVLGIVGVLLAGNVTFHTEALQGLATGLGTRIGVSATLLLIILIGGRIIPSFTRNWLARQSPGPLPAPFGRLDLAAITVAGAALAAWIAAPGSQPTAGLALLAAILHCARLARWAGARTLGEPLVAILHVAYAFVPLGFALQALAIVRPDAIAPSGAVHAWTTGAIGLMTLAVMTRASLGHTGQPLTATWPIQLIYIAAITAACARIAAAFGLLRDPMLSVSATAWVLAFVGFAVYYGPLLLRSRPSASDRPA